MAYNEGYCVPLRVVRYTVTIIGAYKAGSQHDANATLRYDVKLKCWNRLYFYPSVASVTSEQLTLAAMFLSAIFIDKNVSPSVV